MTPIALGRTVILFVVIHEPQNLAKFSTPIKSDKTVNDDNSERQKKGVFFLRHVTNVMLN